MRFLIILPYLEENGTEKHTFLLSRYLLRAGHQVTVAAPGGPMAAAFQTLGVNLLCLPPLSLGSFWSAMRRSQAVAKNVDLVHVHAAQEICGGIRLTGYRGPLVFTAHCYHSEIDYAKAGLFLNPFCQRVIAVSKTERERLARFGVKRLVTIWNGIDLEPGASSNRSAARAARKLSDDLVVAIAVGRLARPKRLDILLRAMVKADCRVHAWIIGDGPAEHYLRALAKQLKIEERVIFWGRQTAIASWFAAADIYVSASQREGLSLAALEAMSAGLPLVLSDIPEFREIAKNGHAGLFFPTGQPAALAANLSLLAQQRSLRARLGEAARAASITFSWERMGRETLELYRAACQG
ncbi:MAG: glycosyltransferase family 4 protein [Cyanobacteria bacterium NC_groundwater_1444_Ag_S-0.65um_54_12]|nr:glycosyltransferase family 4 protein [Cyanobacteria bacterium NC_groundwater_1444_Ag_S-0.65um_54_12]